MPEHLIRVTQTQLLADSSDIVLQGATPAAAAQIVLDAVSGDPDDETGTRRYRLPDGRTIELDPERAVGGEVYAEIIEDGRVVQTIGRSAPLILADDEAAALRELLEAAISEPDRNGRGLLRSVLGQLGEQQAAPPIRRFLDLSTAHLRTEDRLFLECSANPGSLDGLAAMSGTFGWFVYAYEERGDDGISDVLWAIFERARALGCAYVLFNADAPILDDLSVFESEDDEEPADPT